MFRSYSIDPWSVAGRHDVRTLQGGRVPSQCPPGTQTRYTVKPGDTMFFIAQRFDVSLDAMIAVNPHIEDPSVIFPGDVLCIPGGAAQLPCCVFLSVRELDARGSALIEPFGSLGQFSVGVLVEDLPPASEFGNFNAYLAEVIIPGEDQFDTGLHPVEGEPTLMAGRLILSFGDSLLLPTDTRIFIRPVNTDTAVKGPAILQGSLAQCIA